MPPVPQRPELDWHLSVTAVDRLSGENAVIDGEAVCLRRGTYRSLSALRDLVRFLMEDGCACDPRVVATDCASLDVSRG